MTYKNIIKPYNLFCNKYSIKLDDFNWKYGAKNIIIFQNKQFKEWIVFLVYAKQAAIIK